MSYKQRHMLTNECIQSKINNLRVILNCFYIYLIFDTFQYVKQVIFQYPYSLSIIYTKIYLIIRSFVSAFCIILYSILIIYSLWSKHVGILLNSIILLTIFLAIRFIFDLHGYIIGYFEYSLYPPFELIRKNLTKINNNKQKQILEEITDFTIELIRNLIGIILTISIFIRMIGKKWKRKQQMELEALKTDGTRRITI